jgi:hypothetical protein
MRRAPVMRSLVEASIHAAAASAVGLVGLPFVFGRSELVVSHAWMWLALATATSVWLIAPGPLFTAAIQRLMTRISSTTLEHQTMVELSRLVLAAAYIIVIQAIVRRPLVALIGIEAEPFIVEAVIAALALLALLTLLSQIHHAGRPLIEGLARSTLDALIPTTGSDHTTATADDRTSRIASAPTFLAGADRRSQSTLAGTTLVAARRTPRD